MTVQLYLKDTYLFHSESSILRTEEDEKGVFAILDQTVFYPQGGGQPSDQGAIKNDRFEAAVISVRQVNDEIRHYITLARNEILINSTVDCLVNKERRMLNSRYHTAGHLLGNIVEKLYPKFKAVKGHSFPNEAYIEFAEAALTAFSRSDEAMDFSSIQTVINEAIAKNDKTEIFEIDSISFEQKFYKLPYSIPGNKKFRAMQIGDMPPVPCGGTHLSSIGEIGSIAIGKIKTKNNVVRISYEVI